ncbi:hypothetical protein FRC01_014603, partial [Tulasnella sp. 417]
MTVEEMPSQDKLAPEHHRYPPPSRIALDTDTPPKKPKWDKSRAIKGKPTTRFR